MSARHCPRWALRPCDSGNLSCEPDEDKRRQKKRWAETLGFLGPPGRGDPVRRGRGELAWVQDARLRPWRAGLRLEPQAGRADSAMLVASLAPAPMASQLNSSHSVIPSGPPFLNAASASR